MLCARFLTRSSLSRSVYPDWTQACVDFLINEVPQEASNEKTLLDHVWKQYIDSDLAEIATPALPDLGYDLGQAHKVSIGAGAGCGIILQIMDIMEMQFSKLSMLGDVEKELEGRKFGGYQRIYLNADEQNDENGGDANAMGIPPTQLAPGASQGPAVNVEETHKAKTVNFHRGMLKFILTDGHQKIEGMELKIVPGLSMYTPPGTKVCSLDSLGLVVLRS